MKKILGLIMMLFAFILVSCNKSKIEVTSIVADSKNITINIEKELEIEIMVLPADATNKELEWKVLNETIASVTKTGILKGLTLGETKLVITSVTNPNVNETINIFVVNDIWPNDILNEKFLTTIPKFPDYTSIKTEEESNVVTITLLGYKDIEKSLEEYEKSLILEGFIRETTNDNHIGKYTNEEKNVVISYHNSESHGKKELELKITKLDNHHDHYHYSDFIKSAYDKFELALPVFVNVHEVEDLLVNTDKVSANLVVLDKAKRRESIVSFIVELEKDGCVLEKGTAHYGSHKKGEYLITYHEDHHHEELIFLEVSKIILV